MLPEPQAACWAENKGDRLISTEDATAIRGSSGDPEAYFFHPNAAHP